jgi:hypothetical protein
MIDRKSLESLLGDLRREGQSMGKLIKRVKTIREWEARSASRASTRMAKFFAQVQVRAVSLYKAACQQWKCDSHDQHVIMMRLENRIVTLRQTVHSTAGIIFRLCLPETGSLLQEIEVMAREGKQARFVISEVPCGIYPSKAIQQPQYFGFQHVQECAGSS